MKFTLLLLFVFVSAPLFAQQPVYQQFEVDSAAQPHGGPAYLNLFLQTNLRKPIPAQAVGKAVRATVTGIIEPDGRLTEVKAIPSKSPDMDREAVRVFRLFNAWQPAIKGGERVRQAVNFPVIFKANEPFVYADGARIDYFDASNKPVQEGNEKIRYKQVTPLDSTGLPTGDIVVFAGKGASWTEESRLTFVRNLIPAGPSREAVQQIGHQTPDKSWTNYQYTLNSAGNRLNQQYFLNGIPIGLHITYHDNGLVKLQSYTDKETFSSTEWYPNGQLKETRTRQKPQPGSTYTTPAVSVYWTGDGKQLVKDGNGFVHYESRVKSKKDTSQSVTFIEEGLFQNGLRHGRWTGHNDNGAYFYEDIYDNGAFITGKAVNEGSDTLVYKNVEVQPEFKGGMQGLGNFLASNLRYPESAQKDNVQGRVFVSFVVCEDGSLCDYEIVKWLHPDVDQEALRVTKAMSGRWKPGEQRGRKVKVKYNLPINFSLR